MIKICSLLIVVLCLTNKVAYGFDAEDCARLSEKFNENVDDTNRYFTLNTGDDIKNFDEANRVCNLCFDGSLLIYNETKTLPDNILHWIGIRKLAGSTDWQWATGEVIDDWKLYANKFKKQIIDPKANYSAVAYKNGSMITWISIHDKAFKSNGRMASMIDNVSPTLFYGYIINRPLAVTCRRPVRDHCHYWNYTELECIWDEKFGCHGYSWMMFHHSDNVQSKCAYHPNERFAFPCPDSSCIRCDVTDWTEWSSCSVKFCRDGMGVKKRHREMLSAVCPDDLFYISLKQVKDCWVTGCDSLLNETMLLG